MDVNTPTTVLATASNVTALADLGSVQQIRVTIPAGTAFTPPPAPGSVRDVRIQVQFNGGTGTSAPLMKLTVQF
jgi:hypothetical protein